jgi:hypothetical protein
MFVRKKTLEVCNTNLGSPVKFVCLVKNILSLSPFDALDPPFWCTVPDSLSFSHTLSLSLFLSLSLSLARALSPVNQDCTLRFGPDAHGSTFPCFFKRYCNKYPQAHLGGKNAAGF